MGTRVTLSTWDDERSRGLERLETLLRSLEAVDRQLSTWKPDSEISRLNGATSRVQLSPEVCGMFRELDRWTRETGGTFDPAVGALTAAWGVHEDGRLPSETELEAARARSGWEGVSFDAVACTAGLSRGVSIDVGAFGKGAALDAARDAAGDRSGPWLIDAGGQIAVAGAPPGERAWTVLVADPSRRTRPALRVPLASGSLATSGRSERDLRVGSRRVGHILDPHTGTPARFTGAVSVWHERALVADALSTALFVMGPARGIGWADERRIAACYLEPGGRVRPSRAFRALTGG